MRVLPASPSPLMREMLAAAFAGAAEIDVVSFASTVPELVTHARRDRPDVVVCDATFPDGDLAELVPSLLRGSARVLVVCDEADSESAAALLLAGASGLLSSEESGPGEVLAAARQVAVGDAVLHPAAAATVLRMWRASRETPHRDVEAPPPAPVLTARENEVLEAMARGLPTKSIGRELGVSPKTVESHVARVLTKLGARNRAQAVALAEKVGLLRG